MPVFTVLGWLYSNDFIVFKPMGCGRGGGFEAVPSLHQWTLLFATKPDRAPKLPAFCAAWLRWFNPQTRAFAMTPMEGHGSWDGQAIFGALPRRAEWQGPVGILTRASIRLRSVRSFFAQVGGIQESMKGAPGLQFSIGMGELPLIKQATFSHWDSVDAMKAFAYQMQAHRDVVKQTRQEAWYSEEMFVRFRIEATARGKAKEIIRPGGTLILQAI